MLTSHLFTAIVLLSKASAIPFKTSNEISNVVARAVSDSVTTIDGLAWYDSNITRGNAGRTNLTAYTCFGGPAANFPAMSTWMNFNAMWKLMVQYALTPVKDTAAEQTAIYNAILNVSQVAKVDPRVILAVIIDESTGNVRVNCTTSYGGVNNCGIMQTYNGSAYVASQMQASITQMVSDGTQGTTYGPGLVQYFNDASNTAKQTNENVYAVMRSYNSGKVNASELSDGLGATPAYVSNIANFLQGWIGYGEGPEKCGFKNTIATTTSAPTCASSAYVAPPKPTVAGTTSSCCTWVSVVSGDGCYSIETKYGITNAQFRAWNTYVNAACDNLWAGYAYCVNSNAAVKLSSSSSSSIPATTPTSTSTKAATTSTLTSVVTTATSTSVVTTATLTKPSSTAVQTTPTTISAASTTSTRPSTTVVSTTPTSAAAVSSTRASTSTTISRAV